MGCKHKDEVGNRYGKLSVLSRVDRKGRVKWLCACDCGQVVEVFASDLRSGNTKSCGCLRKIHPGGSDEAIKKAIKQARSNRIKRVEDMIGSKFGKLTVIGISDRIGKTDSSFYAECRCDCGVVKSVRASTLRGGYTKSCGCLKKRRPRKLSERKNDEKQ